MTREPVFTWETVPHYEARLADNPALLAARMQQAAVGGDAKAQLGMAHMLLKGRGTECDPEAAFRWFQLAARSGHPDAINMVGRCHELGWGTPLNTRIAAQCYRAAGEMGHGWANFNLAMLMLERDGAEGETSEILALLVRSARRGNAKAMNLIGQACEDGWRGQPKLAAARRWYARAAKRGCFRGAFNTARHLMGVGDVDDAVRWLRRSIDAAPYSFCKELASYLSGHPDARLREIAALAREQTQADQEPPLAKVPLPEVMTARIPRAYSGLRSRIRRGVARAITRFGSWTGT